MKIDDEHVANLRSRLVWLTGDLRDAGRMIESLDAQLSRHESDSPNFNPDAEFPNLASLTRKLEMALTGWKVAAQQQKQQQSRGPEEEGDLDGGSE